MAPVLLVRLAFIAEQPAPAPRLAHPEGRAALHIVLVTVRDWYFISEQPAAAPQAPWGLSELIYFVRLVTLHA